jgi:membrane protease YdiL (CAAX protease family)
MRRILAGLLLFFGGIILISAVLSPWIFWSWNSLTPWDEPFRRVFNRVLMVSAVLLLWPLARYWGISSWKHLGIGDFSKIRKDLLWWFICGVASVTGLFLIQILFEVRGWKGTWAFLRLFEFLASAWIVGFVEEILFRGLLFCALFQVVREYSARAVRVAVLTSIFFATTHYLKAVNPVGEIDWSSGWFSWWTMLLEFGDARMLALRWVSLLLVGLVLCALAYRKKTLWACMGLHAGWVFGLKALNQATEWNGGNGSWWFQGDILSGVSAEIMLLVILGFIVFRMKERSI